ncbi:MAG: hypothetical protein R3C03_17685 [Pirellulaceae bacterium]
MDNVNASPTGITTDGERLWVVDDLADKVFVYSLVGGLLGSWSLDSGNDTPSGITNDANGGSSLWVVDRAGKVFPLRQQVRNDLLRLRLRRPSSWTNAIKVRRELLIRQ